MRAIGSLPSEKQARLFGDYLLVQGVRNQIEAEADGSWLIWVADDDQLAVSREFLEKFRSDPTAQIYSAEAASADRVRAEERKSEAAWRRRVRGRRQIL